MTVPRWIYALEDPLPPDISAVSLLGGKGHSLRRLAAAQLIVPRGFTITTAACREALRSDSHWPAGLETQLHEAIEQLTEQIGRPFGSGPAAFQLAVRSGAEFSMPGMLDTLLDCGTTFSELRAAIQTVFLSWRSERARAWRRRNQLDESAGTAVTVQELITPDCSGVMFTVTPESVTPESVAAAQGLSSASMTVEAVAGRGDALVAGHVTPQRFLIDRNTLHSHCQESSSEILLNPDQLCSLATTGLMLERLFETPQDIEWGLTQTGFVFFQTRPIACALSADADASAGIEQIESDEIRQYRQSESRRLSERLTGGRVLVRHNLAETLPAPTPMTWSVIQRMMSGAGGLGRLYRVLGYAPGGQAATDSFLELVAGRVYADPDRMVQLFAAEWPLCHDYALLRKSPHSLDESPRHFDPDRTHPLLLLLLPHLAWVLFRSHRRIKTLMRTSADRYAACLPAWTEWVDAQSARNLSGLSPEQLLTNLESRVHRTVDLFAAESLLPGTVGAIAMAELHRRITRFADAATADEFRQHVLASLENPIPARQTELLRQLASGKPVLPDFLSEFGHRGPCEMELSQPRWTEQHPQPDSPDSAADTRVSRPAHTETPAQRLQTLYTAAGLSRQSQDLQSLLIAAQQLLPLRESGRHHLMAGFALIRDSLQTLANRFDLGDGIYFLQLDELQQFHRGNPVSSTLEKRRMDYLAAQQLSVPDFLDLQSAARLVSVQPPDTRSDQTVYDASPLSAGHCRGPVACLRTAAPPSRIPQGSVLVTSAIDPGLTPLLLQAAGVIVEHGGLLSHGAVVARQLGIPVVRCSAAVRALQDGDSVQINSTTAQITLISTP